MHANRLTNSSKCSQRGSVAVEFALVLIPLLLMVGGIVEFGRALWHANVLTKATRDGARVMSGWARFDWEQGVDKSLTRVIETANASGLTQPLKETDVAVECAYAGAAFSFKSCADTRSPVNVRVRILAYPIVLGQWMPFMGPQGWGKLGTVVFTPASTMPYMGS
jgi:hypothetical protein